MIHFNFPFELKLLYFEVNLKKLFTTACIINSINSELVFNTWPLSST